MTATHTSPARSQILDEFRELDEFEREKFLGQLSAIHRLELKTADGYFERSPEVCGGVPRVPGTRIPVWTLERMRQLGMSELDILQSLPALRAIDLSRAFAFAELNREEIELAVAENERDD